MSSDPHKQALTTSTPLLQEDSLAPDHTVMLESQNELKEMPQSRSRSRVHVGVKENDVSESLSPVPTYDSVNQVSAYKAPITDPGKDEKYHARTFAEYTAKTPSSQYADFHTVDWVRDTVRDLKRYKKLDDSNTCMGWLYKQWDAVSAWVLVFLVGLASGVMAGAIDLGTAWFVSFRNGICTSDFTLDEYSCCWSSNQTSFDVEHCREFAKWSNLFGINPNTASGDTGAYFFNYFIYVLIAVIFGFLASSFVKNVAPYASGSGIPEVKTILSGYVIHGYLGKATLTVKSIGMMLAVGAGLSLGKEGPLVHVACCCGNIFSYLFPKYRKNQAKRKEILSAAAAAGVGVAFGAPIGGVLFSLEEVSYYFPLKTLWRAFFCALVAAATLKYLNPYPNGNLVEFYVSYDAPWHLFELFGFGILGILGGLYGAIFIRANVFWSSLRKKYWKKYAITEVCLVCFGTALLAFPNPFTRADGSEVIRELFSQCGPDTDTDLCRYNLTSAFETTGQYHDTQALKPVYDTLWMLALAGIYKLVTVTFTYGIKIPAGLFIPSMYVGACVGRIIGVLTEQLVYANRESSFVQFFCPVGSTCIVPGLYAMVGAAAFLGGVTRMTVSLVVIMFELTGGLPYIVPIMLAALLSKWVGDNFSEGIYDEHIKLNRYPFIEAKERYTFDAQASDIMSPQPHQHPLVFISATESSVGDLEELLDTYNFWGFPVVMTIESQLSMGYVTHMELQEALNTMRRECGNIDPTTLVHFLPPNEVKSTSGRYLNFYSLLDTTQFQVTPVTHMYNVVELFKKVGLRQLIITHNGKVTGIITKKDIVKHLEEIEHHHDSQALMRLKAKIGSIFF